MMKTSGQIAYEAFYETRYGQELLSHVAVPPYQDLEGWLKDSWEVAAEAVIRDLRKGLRQE